MSREDLLLEIGTEELPPGLLPHIAEELGRNLSALLEQSHLDPGRVKAFAAPRRIAVRIQQVCLRQPDREETRLGPPVTAARDAEGNPTPAGAGFARSCGVAFADLEEAEDSRGTRLAHTRKVAGQAAGELLPDLVARAGDMLEIPRRMRWGSRNEEFVRPVHWLVLLLGSEVIDACLWGVQSGRETRGHRFHAPEPITLPSATEYENLLAEGGRVMADFQKRRDLIREQVENAAAQLKGRAVIQPALLDEVTALVEWPVVLSGHFDERFLAVPQEALITTMCANQKYFPVLDAEDRLLPHFVLVSNLESTQPDLVQAGNERVIRPRFADAEFFYAEDRRHPLSHWAQGLDRLAYQDKLGSMADRSARIAQIASTLATRLGASSDDAEQAAALCKADLLTLMVQEFPKLQGIMGRYYAQQEGLPAAVAIAIEEHYLPRHADDRLPTTALGRALAMADRIELITGFFAVGKQPTGDKDPYGLRRAALGLIRILLDSDLRIDLQEVIRASVQLLPKEVAGQADSAVMVRFVMQRTEIWLQSQGLAATCLQAVAARGLTDVVDFVARARAIESFQALPSAGELAAANKRVANILAKTQQPDTIGDGFDAALLQDPAETRLYEALCDARQDTAPLLKGFRYVEALERLSQLQGCIARFFDEVMVNCEDTALRRNRQELLATLRGLFLEVADISLLRGIESR